MVVRVPHLWNQTTREVQFYLTSLNCDARNLGQMIRLHWGVENGLHWTLAYIRQVRSQNVVFLKYKFFRITNQSTRYRALRHSGRDY